MFFALSKVFWIIADPINLLLICLCIGALFLLIGWQKWGRRIVVSVVSVWLLLAVVPIGSYMYISLENRFPVVKWLPENVDGIIALGGVVNQFVTEARGQVAIGGAAERLTEFAKLAKRYPNAKAVFTTGSGSLTRQDIKEADVVSPLLENLGLRPFRVIYENQSRNTHENATLSKEMLKPKKNETWILITSGFHMPRSVGVFRKAGWNVIPYPVDFNTTGEVPEIISFNTGAGLGRFSTALHEWIGLLVYYLTGRTSEIFPSPILEEQNVSGEKA
jgi:uncharacterized SAM-binding protein YcdF (DUF218 family)